MFPFELDEEVLQEAPEEPAAPVEYGIDFAAGQPTDALVFGSEAVKVWAWYALQIPRYRYEMYTWNYGCEVEELIGSTGSPEYIASETKRMVEDCLLANPDITGIEDFESVLDGDRLTISFRLITPYGEEVMNV
jgi:hypothetical protein